MYNHNHIQHHLLTTRMSWKIWKKRVKSRFSHRIMNLSRSNSIEDFNEICFANLCVPETKDPVSKTWNSVFKKSLESDGYLRPYAERVYNQTKLVKHLLHHCLLPIANFSGNQPYITKSLIDFEIPQDLVSRVKSLSSLDVALLIAVGRLETLSDKKQCSFNMAFLEYTRVTQHAATSAVATGIASASLRVWSRPSCVASWTRLITRGLLSPTVRHSVASRDYIMYNADISLHSLLKVLEHMDAPRALISLCRIVKL